MQQRQEQYLTDAPLTPRTARVPVHIRAYRITRNDKRGAIDESALPILERLNLDPERWCERAIAFESIYQQYRQERRRAA